MTHCLSHEEKLQQALLRKEEIKKAEREEEIEIERLQEEIKQKKQKEAEETERKRQEEERKKQDAFDRKNSNTDGNGNASKRARIDEKGTVDQAILALGDALKNKKRLDILEEENDDLRKKLQETEISLHKKNKEFDDFREINRQRMAAVNTQMALVMREQFARASSERQRMPQTGLINNTIFDVSVKRIEENGAEPALPPIPHSMYQFVNSFLINHNVIPVYLALFVQFRIITTTECTAMKNAIGNFKNGQFYKGLDKPPRDAADVTFAEFNNRLQLMQSRATSYSRMLSDFLAKYCVDSDMTYSLRTDQDTFVVKYHRRNDEILYRFNDALELRNTTELPAGDDSLEYINIFIYRLMYGYNHLKRNMGRTGETDAEKEKRQNLQTLMISLGDPIVTTNEKLRISSALYWMLIFCHYFTDRHTRPVYKEVFKGKDANTQENRVFEAIKALFVESKIDKGAMASLDHVDYGEGKPLPGGQNAAVRDAFNGNQETMKDSMKSLDDFRKRCEDIFTNCVKHKASNKSFKELDFDYYHKVETEKTAEDSPPFLPLLSCRLGFLPLGLNLGHDPKSELWTVLNGDVDYKNFRTTTQKESTFNSGGIPFDMCTRQLIRFFGWPLYIKKTQEGNVGAPAMHQTADIILRELYPYDPTKNKDSTSNWLGRFSGSNKLADQLRKFFTESGIPVGVLDRIKIEVQADRIPASGPKKPPKKT